MIEHGDKQEIASRKRKVQRNIDIFATLKEAGICISPFSAKTRVEDKWVTTSLGMLDLPDDKRKEIMEKFKIDDSFLLGTRYRTLRIAYKKGNMTDKEMEQMENLEMISELDKLEREQASLERRLKEVAELKKEAKSKQAQGKRGKGEVNE